MNLTDGMSNNKGISMGLKSHYNSQEEVPAGMAEFYKEQDGKFVLDIESSDGYALENISGLKNALQNERSLNKEMNKKLQEFEGKQSELMQMMEQKSKEQKVNPNDQLQLKLEEMKKMMQQKDSQLASIKLDSTINKALTGVELVPNGQTLLLPHIKNQVKLIDGTVKVVDQNGNIRIASNGSDVQDMSVDQLLSEMKTSDMYSPIFKGVSASGSGAKTSMGNATTRKAFKDMTLAEKSDIYSKDPTLYEKMKSESN